MIRALPLLFLSIALGGCWPVTETYFSSSATGGKTTYVCGQPGYKLMLHSTNFGWGRINIRPLLLPSGGMSIHIWIDDDSSILYRNAERAVASEPDWTQRRLARNAHAAANSISQKDAKLSGVITVTWPPGNRFEIPVASDSISFAVPNFSGDTAVVSLPPLIIDGQSETLPLVAVQRRTGVTLGGVNGC